MVGTICSCGEGLPAETFCPCTFEGDEDGLGQHLPKPRRPRTIFPRNLDDAMHCLACQAEVVWSMHREPDRGFTCPFCGTYRPSRSARPPVRQQAGDRDGWVCHRCGLAVDPAVGPSPNHPLAAVADHHPVARDDGGPSTLANIKIAHSLCNGSSYLYARAVHANRTPIDGPLMWLIPAHRQSIDERPRHGPATVAITPEQQIMIDTIFEMARGRGGLPLKSLAPDHWRPARMDRPSSGV